jgi:hypothetical protein
MAGDIVAPPPAGESPNYSLLPPHPTSRKFHTVLIEQRTISGYDHAAPEEVDATDTFVQNGR